MSFIGRPTRYDLRLPVRLQAGHGKPWLLGQTTDVSASGALVYGDCVAVTLPVGTTVDLEIVVPPEVKGRQGARIICRGQVVRRAGPAVAIGFTESRLEPAALETASRRSPVRRSTGDPP